LSESEAFSTGWRDAIVNTLSGMSDSERRDLLARVAAPPAVDESNLPLTRRSEFRGKVSQLWDITQAAGPNGHQGIADAAAARAPQATPQPEPPAPQGYAVNRAQGSQSGAGTPPAPTATIRIH
jgi:hypothetical protein